MKLSKWQREKLLELFPEFEAAETVAAIEAILSSDPGEVAAEDDYKRFMAEWKQVGVWQGGKPVRAKLARLAKAGKLDAVWAGLERLRNDPNRPAPEYVPRPMTWLNQERWNDDPYPPRSAPRTAGSVLNIQLDAPTQGYLRQQATPSILGEMNQGRW